MGSGWIAWVIGGVTVLAGAAGVVLAIWALFWDRARGRRRCPQCWQDMAGVPGLRCPECGKAVRAERFLGQTRRRWRPAAAGLLIASLIGPALFGSKRVAQEGVQGFVPTCVLIGLVRYGGASGGAAPWNARYWYGAASNTDSGISTWSARVLVERYDWKNLPAWQRRLGWRAAHDRASADLDLDPPMARGDLWKLLSLFGSANDKPERDPACRDLVTVTLVGPKTAAVGMPLCVEIEGAGFCDDDLLVELESNVQETPMPAIHAYTPGSRARELLIAHPGFTPQVRTCLGTPKVAAEDVWVTARIWRGDKGSNKNVRESPPDAVRRIRLHTSITADEGPRLRPVELSKGPFKTSDGIAEWCWCVAEEPYRPGEFTLMLPEASDELPADLAVGVRIEVLRGETVVFTGAACLWNSSPWVSFPWGQTPGFPFPNTYSVRLDGVFADVQEDALTAVNAPTPNVPASPEPGSDQYKVRIIGDEAVAWWHFGATSYWRGEMAVPIQVKAW